MQDNESIQCSNANGGLGTAPGTASVSGSELKHKSLNALNDVLDAVGRPNFIFYRPWLDFIVPTVGYLSVLDLRSDEKTRRT